MYGTGSLYQRGKVWWAQVYRDGKRLQLSLKTQQRSVAMAKLRKLSRTSDEDFLGTRERSVTVGELVANLLEHYETERKHGYRTTSERRWEQHLKPHFENLRAHRFGSQQQHSYRRARVAEGASNTTVNRELAILSAAFKLGADQDPPLVKRVPRFHRASEKDNVRKGFATREQLEALKQAASAHSLWLRVFVEMLVLLGWRKGEVQELTCRNINLIDNYVRIEESKNGDSREVPLTASLRGMLEQLMVGKQADARLFKTLSSPIWKEVTQAAGVPDLLVHDLRRTSARHKRAAGVDTSVTMKMMGWRSPNMFNRYGIVAVEDKADALAKQEAYEQEIQNKDTVQ